MIALTQAQSKAVFPPPNIPGASYFRGRRQNGAAALFARSGRQATDLTRQGSTYDEVLKADRATFDSIIALLPNGEQVIYAYPDQHSRQEVESPIAATDSAATTKQEPAWRQHRVVVCNGSYDTHINNGQDYQTLTLREVFDSEAGFHRKKESLAMIPSSYNKFDARSHEVQQQRGNYVTLTGDIDGGNVALDTLRGVVRRFIGDEVLPRLLRRTSVGTVDAQGAFAGADRVPTGIGRRKGTAGHAGGS